mmetsp:Transcript_132618/g.296581  ORF Transcript_132618/g.296581 Transcript_132618/m.296581 type:complete len:213 (+) Transcript_132618:42-680(+)
MRRWQPLPVATLRRSQSPASPWGHQLCLSRRRVALLRLHIRLLLFAARNLLLIVLVLLVLFLFLLRVLHLAALHLAARSGILLPGGYARRRHHLRVFLPREVAVLFLVLLVLILRTSCGRIHCGCALEEKAEGASEAEALRLRPDRLLAAAPGILCGAVQLPQGRLTISLLIRCSDRGMVATAATPVPTFALQGGPHLLLPLCLGLRLPLCT